MCMCSARCGFFCHCLCFPCLIVGIVILQRASRPSVWLLEGVWRGESSKTSFRNTRTVFQLPVAPVSNKSFSDLDALYVGNKKGMIQGWEMIIKREWWTCRIYFREEALCCFSSSGHAGWFFLPNFLSQTVTKITILDRGQIERGLLRGASAGFKASELFLHVFWFLLTVTECVGKFISWGFAPILALRI